MATYKSTTERCVGPVVSQTSSPCIHIFLSLAHSTCVSSIPLPKPKTQKTKVPFPTRKLQQEPPQSPLLFETEMDQEEFEGPPVTPGYALDLHLRTPTKVDVLNVEDVEMDEEEEDVVANLPSAQEFLETQEEEDIVEGQESHESQEEEHHQQVAASYRYVLANKCLCIAMFLLRKRLQPSSEIFYTELYRKYL